MPGLATSYLPRNDLMNLHAEQTSEWDDGINIGTEVTRFGSGVYTPGKDDPLLTDPAVLDVAPNTTLPVYLSLMNFDGLDGQAQSYDLIYNLQLVAGDPSKIAAFRYDASQDRYIRYNWGASIPLTRILHKKVSRVAVKPLKVSG